MGDKQQVIPDSDSPSGEPTDSPSEDEDCHPDDGKSDSDKNLKAPLLEDSDALRASVQTRAVMSHQISSLGSARKFILGIVIVFVIAASWVGSTQTAKSTYTATYQQFCAPFFLVWFGTCWMSVVFLFTVPVYFIEKRSLPSSDGLKALMRYIYPQYM